MTSPAFHAGSPEHLAALAVTAALSLAVALAAGRMGTRGRAWLGRALGGALAAYAAVFYLEQARSGALSWEYSLPLDLCSLVALACILSPCIPSRLLRETAYFWGTGGALQALITPDLGGGFPSRDCALFFWGHGGIVACIVFLVAATDFRPGRGSVWRMMAALQVYGASVGAINGLTGWNYGYLCRKPAAPSLLDLLGPWPWYLLALEGVALATFWLLALPWRAGPQKGPEPRRAPP